jgi:lipopolysaccharide transport system ATP-binding protein
MSDIAIRVDNLSKLYRIGPSAPGYETLRDRITDGFRSWVRRPASASPAATTTFWALRNVSFEVRRGEVLGIIGLNGAGKSTLLKLLSRIMDPTEGRAVLHGRVGSLLEVGAGFHGELTGRENVFLSGVILGMKRSEITAKFDDIVDFAGVGPFIDTPVKRYSSGMYVRLAFAVAAHLEPEILIVDEVLAVGDAGFQNRCLGKMGEVARGGRTVLFVSHNMGAVSNLCSSALWLDEGKVVASGDVATTVTAYVKKVTTVGKIDSARWIHAGTGEARILDARLLDSTATPAASFLMGESLVLELDIEFLRRFPTVNVALGIKRLDMNIEVLHLDNEDCGLTIDDVTPGKRRFRIEIPNCMLYPGSYQISPRILGRPATIYDFVRDAIGFSMVQTNVSKRTMPFSLHRQAIFYQPSHWTIVDND